MRAERILALRPLARPLISSVARASAMPLFAGGGRTLYRTNLCLQSQTFDTTWTATDTTVAADNTAAPPFDGSTTADRMTEGSAGTATVVQTVTVKASTQYTWSRYLKRSNGRWYQLLIGNGANQIAGWFDIQNGVVGSSTVGGTGIVRTPVIIAQGNGWYRCCVTGIVGSATAIDFHCFSCSADAGSTRVSSDVRFEWGAQVETGAEATRYIPTLAAAVTDV